MPERGFNTEFWTDPFVRKLTAEAEYLYIYLWTNQRCNQAGLYQITPDVIAFETKLPVEKIPDLLRLLEPKVKWYPEQDLIWVKNFIKHQYKSPKFLIAAANRLKDINNNGAVKELLEYNLKRYSISIPYEYNMDIVSISDSDTNASANAITRSKSSASKGGPGGKAKDIQKNFEIFWQAYPKKRNKGQAEKAFKKAAPDEQLMAEILTAIERAKKSAQWLKDNGQFIPYPATWLNARGWEDEFIEDTSGADKKYSEQAELEKWDPSKPLRPATGNLRDWTKDKPLR
jgi:hypothetical protein